MANESRSLFRRIGSWIDKYTPIDLEYYFRYYLRAAEWNRIRNDVRIDTQDLIEILDEITHEVEEPPKITAIRVGARNKPWKGNLYPLHEAGLLKLHTVEPDEDECERLSNLIDEDYRFHSKGLSDYEGEQTLYLTEAGATSSLYKPTTNHLEQFPWIHSHLNIRETVPVQTTTLNQLCSEQNIAPDIILLDTQGSELDILQGGDDLLDSVFMVQLEARTVPMYQNEPLLPVILDWMNKNSFRILDLDFQRWGADGFVNDVSRPGKRDFQLNAETIEVHSLFSNNSNITNKKESLRRIFISISLGKLTVANRILDTMDDDPDLRKVRDILNEYT